MTISFATAVTTNTQKRESPLYKIRNKLAIGEKLQNLKENIKARFVGIIGNRLLFTPFLYRLSHEDHESRTILTIWTTPIYCCIK